MSIRGMEQATIQQFVSNHSHLLVGKVLDFGCGLQPYSSYVQGDYHPYDRADFPASVATEDLGSDLPLMAPIWDAILCTQVIQYLDFPLPRLGQLCRALVKGGWLVMTGPTNWPVVEKEDLWRFTPAGIEQMMRQAGLIEVVVRERHSISLMGEDFLLGWGAVGEAPVIVIDVGCATWGGDESIETLVRMFKPDVLYGFDPGLRQSSERIDSTGTRRILSQQAAWVRHEYLGFRVKGLGGQFDRASASMVETIDLAEFILGLDDTEIVLKMDCEGAEYDIVPHLVAQGADERLRLMMVEWHCAVCGYGIWNNVHPDGCTADPIAWLERREMTKQGVRCRLEEWNK